jgi:hypothetical protein
MKSEHLSESVERTDLDKFDRPSFSPGVFGVVGS